MFRRVRVSSFEHKRGYKHDNYDILCIYFVHCFRAQRLTKLLLSELFLFKAQ